MIPYRKLIYQKEDGSLVFKKSTLIIYFLLCYILGVAARSLWSFSIIHFLCVVSLVFLALIGMCFRKKKLFRVFVALSLGSVFLCLGIWRVVIFLPQSSETFVGTLNTQVVSLEATIISEPDERKYNTQYIIKPKGYEGNILIFAPLFPAYSYGDQISVLCRFEAPAFIDSFNYPGFLAKESVYLLCFDPLTLQLLVPSDGGVRNWFFAQKQAYKSIIDRSVRFETATFINSIILGLRREISEDTQEYFAKTGTSHIMAISGMHMVILTGILLRLCRLLSIPKKYAVVGAVLFIVFFLMLIGFKASALRAGIFGAVGSIAFIAGRPKQSFVVLLWAAAVLLTINPLLLVYDVGFQLSFLAVLGLITTGRLFKKWLMRLPELWGGRDILIMTLAAQVFVIPWIMWHFNMVSIISPLVNILILPVIPIIILFSIVLISTGLISLVLSRFVGLILDVLVGYVIFTAKYLSAMPFASISGVFNGWHASIVFGCTVLFLYKPFRSYILHILRHRKIYFRKNQVSEQDKHIVTETVDISNYQIPK